MKEPNNTNPELKRLKSVKEKIKTYQNQQSAIKAALDNTDQKLNKKIIFDENGTSENSNVDDSEKRKRLFESDSEEEDNYNFEPKSQFIGKDGQKLLELQTKFKGDKRFTLDERFIEKEDNENETQSEVVEDSLEKEKKLEMGILEEVLGSKLKKRPPKENNLESGKKKMLRYDPDHPEHSKFETEVPSIPKKQKRKQRDQENANIEESQPQVSKDVFYKVNDELKNVFQEPQPFSLLNLFGQKEETREKKGDDYFDGETTIAKTFPMETNPFRYDSSEDEQDEVNEKDKNEVVEENTNAQKNDSNFWGNQFFFREDDYRFQEGADFVRRIAGEQKSEFEVQRRNLKQLVKTKVKNIQKKKNPFRKKLGGNKKKKFLRIKKAMKK